MTEPDVQMANLWEKIDAREARLANQKSRPRLVILVSNHLFAATSWDDWR
jgi:hypothetical protein